MFDILEHIPYSKENHQVGISRLLGNHSFSKAFPLHDVRCCNTEPYKLIYVFIRVLITVRVPTISKMIGRLVNCATTLVDTHFNS